MLTSLNLNAPVELLLMRMPWGPLEAIWAPSTVTAPWALEITMPLPVSVNGVPGGESRSTAPPVVSTTESRKELAPPAA